MADGDEVIFLWLNGLAGTFAPLDTAIQWVVSDYLVPAAMAMTLVALWFAGTDLASRTRNQVGALAALGSMAISSGVVFAINAMYFRTRPFDDLDVSLLFYEPTDSSFPANAMAASFGSTCHGAGRAESRTHAKKMLRGRDIGQELEARGIVAMARGWASLAEEAPAAYKDVADVTRVAENAGLSRNVARLRPLGVIKG